VTTVSPEGARPTTIAAFDFDGTLTTGGSVFPFLVAVRGVAPVVLTVVQLLPKLIHSALVGGTVADTTKETLFARLLAGRPAQEVDEVAAAFAERHLHRRLRTEVLTRLEWHRQQGDTVLIVSASPECYIRAAGEILGVDGVLATRLAVGGSGHLTGRYEGKNCRGTEKYNRTIGWMRAHGIGGGGSKQPVLWAYGNSRGDLRLLNAADHGVDAGRLGRLGRLRRFPTLATVVAATRAERRAAVDRGASAT
jgi:phosphatidylglycerophosphatase C